MVAGGVIIAGNGSMAHGEYHVGTFIADLDHHARQHSVHYYCIEKRRYTFWHTQRHNGEHESRHDIFTANHNHNNLEYTHHH